MPEGTIDAWLGTEELESNTVKKRLTVGATSQTGWEEYSQAVEAWYIDIVWTWSKVTRFKIGNFHGEHESGIQLLNEKTIQSSVEELKEVLCDVLLSDEPVDIVLHAMSMAKMSDDYPEELIEALYSTWIKINGLLLISYEDGYSNNNRQGSHVYYPVRNSKKAKESSVIKLWGKIIDLITFDSPSAKVIGLTFLWVVGDFVMFLDKNPDHPISLMYSWLLKEFLWPSYDSLLEAFEKFPLRWPLKKGQRSMKTLAKNWDLNPVINEILSTLSAWRLSYISGILSKLYLTLSIYGYTSRINAIMESPDERSLQSWDNISKLDVPNHIEKQMEDNFSILKDKISFKPTSTMRRNTMHVETARTRSNDAPHYTRHYKFNPEHLSTISDHFGIWAYILSANMWYKSGLIWRNEYIKEWNPESLLFAGDDIKLIRESAKWWRDCITIKSDAGKNESFATLVIADRPKEIQSEPQEGFDIPIEDKEIDLNSFPHSKPWADTFHAWIPKRYNGIELDPLAAIVEHIWFKIAGMLINNPDDAIIAELKSNFDKFKNFSPNKISWKFAKDKKKDLHPKFEKLIESLDPDYYKDIQIKIISAKFVEPTNGMMPYLVIGTEERVWETVISRHELRFN